MDSSRRMLQGPGWIRDHRNESCDVLLLIFELLLLPPSFLGFGGKRSGDGELVLSQVQSLEWGLMIVDEVQVMPARTFRTVATTVKAHCILGLTATLVREDNLIYDLHWLIGPKLYEASWQQLQEEGFIARVRCVEVWCEMTRAFFAEYLRGQDEKNEHLRRALWTCNPTKLNVCEYLIRFHENRGDKIIVFSDNIFILEEFAKQLGRYYICGKVDMRERMQILSNFADCRPLVSWIMDLRFGGPVACNVSRARTCALNGQFRAAVRVAVMLAPTALACGNSTSNSRSEEGEKYNDSCWMRDSGSG
ncbi:unnamed protein product [Prorocentrum cordatum]|uniref:ERCC3/RAD25/XPB helicase C-terminal domain-containing protein n=1 Tax=Prorocentrum cordatum TaxID=2364126 RepID=A0ABN9UAF3_9DINO|nr:unnamed protein product [Polarella glacialis]